jgi:hypothetical protein
VPGGPVILERRRGAPAADASTPGLLVWGRDETVKLISPLDPSPVVTGRRRSTCQSVETDGAQALVHRSLRLQRSVGSPWPSWKRHGMPAGAPTPLLRRPRPAEGETTHGCCPLLPDDGRDWITQVWRRRTGIEPASDGCRRSPVLKTGAPTRNAYASMTRKYQRAGPGALRP